MMEMVKSWLKSHVSLNNYNSAKLCDIIKSSRKIHPWYIVYYNYAKNFKSTLKPTNVCIACEDYLIVENWITIARNYYRISCFLKNEKHQPKAWWISSVQKTEWPIPKIYHFEIVPFTLLTLNSVVVQAKGPISKNRFYRKANVLEINLFCLNPLRSKGSKSHPILMKIGQINHFEVI